jgi:hypothetical protein
MWSFIRFALFVVGALVLFGATTGLYWEQFYSALQSDGQVVTATVIRVEPQSAPAGEPSAPQRATVHFTFQSAAGRSYDSARVIAGDGVQFLRAGSKLQVRYMPSAPNVHEIVLADRSRQDAGFGRWSLYLVLALFGAGVLFWASDTPRLRKPRISLSIDDVALGEASATAPATGGIAKRFR